MIPPPPLASPIPILMYHEISEQDIPWCVSPSAFEQQMRWLKKEGWKSISLCELKEKVEKSQAPNTKYQAPIKQIPSEVHDTTEKLFVLTFDDGRSGVYEHAFPLLKELGFTATLFVVPQWVERKDIPKAEQYSAFLNWEELRELQDSGFEIGSHSYSHRDVTHLAGEELLQELTLAEQAIEKNLQKKVRHFCYPFGKFSSAVVEEVNKRYEIGVTTQRGFSRSSGKYARQWVLRDTPLDIFQKLFFPPKISLCMIVKDEEQFLGPCLDSVKGAVDEIIVVDTGSMDRTKEIALQHQAKVYDFPWCDDFAAARNFSLQQATGEWILVLDADEELIAAEHDVLREAVQQWEVEGFQILTRNYSNDSTILGWQPLERGSGKRAKDFQGWFPSLKVRLFQGKENIRFQGAVHELVEDTLQKKASLPITVHHYGALRHNSGQKTEMHLALTQKKVAEQPEQAKTYFELGVQYLHLGNFFEAERAFRRSLQLDSVPFPPQLQLATVLQKQGKITEAKEIYQRILQKKSSAEAHFGLGYCFFAEQELKEATQQFARAVQLNPRFVEAYVNLGAVLEKQGRFSLAEKALLQALSLMPRHARAHYNLGVVLEKAGNLQGALERYQKAIELGYAKKEAALARIREIELVLNSKR